MCTNDTTDPDSGVMIQKGQPPMQGSNAQAAVTTNQIIVAAEVTTTPPDFAKLQTRSGRRATRPQLAGVTERPVTVLADAGYWHSAQRPRALRQAQVQHRAGVRPDQSQPPPGPLPTKRRRRRPF